MAITIIMMTRLIILAVAMITSMIKLLNYITLYMIYKRSGSQSRHGVLHKGSTFQPESLRLKWGMPELSNNDNNESPHEYFHGKWDEWTSSPLLKCLSSKSLNVSVGACYLVLECHSSWGRWGHDHGDAVERPASPQASAENLLLPPVADCILSLKLLGGARQEAVGEWVMDLKVRGHTYKEERSLT